MNPPRSAPVAVNPSGGTLLVVAEFEEVAKRIESYLRNAGHPLRAAWIADLEELEDSLRRSAPDLVLASDQLASTPLREVIGLCAKHAPTLPVVALSSQLRADDTVAALAAGARDLVSNEDRRALRHLELVCLRELALHASLRELQTTRLRLSDFESRHLQLLEGTADAVVHIQEGILSHANPAFAQLLGYDKPDELLSLPVMDIVCADHQPKVKEHLKLLGKGKVDGKPLACCLQHREGARISVQAQLTRGSVDGENFIEMLIRAAVSPAPATVPSAAAASSEPAASPELADRLAFFTTLSQAPAVADSRQIRAVVLIAIDGFQALEDRIGYEDSVRVVREVGQQLRSRLGAGDQLFRFSTGEFALILHRATASEMEKFGELLCRELAAHLFVASQHEAHITITFTAYPLAGGENVQQVVTELVLEARKLSGKGGNRAGLIGPTAKASSEDREEARKAAQIRKAIEEGRLKLAYQSIASLEGDTRQHFDVLVRMVDESGREMHAAEFIRTAARFNLMRAIDRWVTMRALKVLSKRDGTNNSMLFVKLSEETLRDAETFLSWLQELLKTRPLRPDELCFQIQEVILQNHIRKAKALTHAVQALGAAVAIEHFGIGTNSVQLLDHIPASFLKFHMSFTNSFNDKDIQKKMTTLMEVAKQRGAKTIVCHVEDANVMARMWQMGVNYIQGYHVQEPEVVLLSADVMRS